MDTISFKNCFNSGDQIYSLPGIQHICEQQGKKANIYMWLDMDGMYYQGAVHPYGSKMLPEKVFLKLKPLIEAQWYVNSCNPWRGEDIMYNLDKSRDLRCSMPYGHISRWYFYMYPELTCNLSIPSLKVYKYKRELNDKILINRSQRYHNDFISYFFLKQYKDHIVFTGLPFEYELFRKEWGFDVEFQQYGDFLDLAEAIASCKFFIGNQSMCSAIAEGLKVKRILEICKFAPHCIPNGDNGYDFHTQNAFEYFVDMLFYQNKASIAYPPPVMAI